MRRRWNVALVAAGITAVLIGGAALPAAAAPQAATAELCAPADQTGDYRHGPLAAAIEVTDTTPECLRTYALDSGILDNEVDRTFTERADRPRLRTGSALLDGVYALALAEEKQLSVNSVSNSDYNGGAPISCTADGEGCYITGENWSYVWTRDLSYAADLGLAAVDPIRARNSLDFKLSERRDTSTDAGADLQILQDTGTGGSYPNSTDRVSWAVGATEILPWLPDGDREEFAARAYEAISHTIEHDRHVVFDQTTGLYRGETSFLDWRQQTYPAWTAADVTQITTSESLSTNVTHWVAIDAAANLADAAGHRTEASTYRAWADALRSAIRDRFWLAERGQFSQTLGGGLNAAPTERYDALATALAVITGVATDAQAAQAVANYPQTPFGPSVIWPQQQEDERSYHNKGIWPFVTAYMLRAAAEVGNDQAATAQIDSLVRSSALFATNYENMNITTGDVDTALNSRRQTWSVAGTLGMFQEVLFGIAAQDAGLTITPFLPAQVRQQYFAGSDRISLERVDFRGHTVDVVLDLPADAAAQGAYTIASLSVDGVPHEAGTPIAPEQLKDHSVITVQLAAPAGTVAGPAVTSTYSEDADDWLEPYAGDEAVFGPTTPAITSVPTPAADGQSVAIGIDLKGEDPAALTMDVIRDGKLVAAGVPAATTWTDTTATASSRLSYCYSVRTTYTSSGNASQDADPVCHWGADFDRITKIEADEFTVTGGSPHVVDGVVTHYMDWGTADTDTLSAEFSPQVTGVYQIQADYALGYDIRSGVTSGIKRVTVTEHGGPEAGNGIMVLPNTDAWDKEGGSTLVPVRLEAGKTYTITLGNDRYTANMSYFQANALYNYTQDGPKNIVDVFRLKAMLSAADAEQLDVAVTAASDAEAEVGQDVSLEVSATGSADLVAEDVQRGVTVDWGDGTVQSLDAVAAADGGFVAARTHLYAAPGTYAVTVTGRSQQGESVATHTVTVRAAATLSVAPAQPDGQNGWYLSTPSAALALTDAPAGTVLQHRFATGDDEQTWIDTSAAFAVPDGAQRLEYRSVGAHGRPGATSVADLAVDTVAPVATVTATTGETDVAVAFAAEDATSGVERTEYRIGDSAEWSTAAGALTVPRAPEARTLQYRAVDRAGNTGATGTLAIEALPDGSTVGGFAVRKELVDDAGLVPAGSAFTVDYFVNGSASPAGSLTVTAGGTLAGPADLPVGTTVRFSEQTPAAVAGGTWQPARIDPGELVIVAGTAPVVTVTNELTRNTGRFSVEKRVEGADAADAVFRFRYAVAGAGEQEFSLKAGESWTSDPLPEGTSVTVTELDAPGLSGKAFTGVTFTGSELTIDEADAATLTIGNGDTRVVTATNDYRDAEGIAVTGGQATGLGLIALVLIAGGAALVVARRKAKQA